MAKVSTKELFNFDLSFDAIIAGCDEAGRGPLAGPVVCAACIMPLGSCDFIDGINDSKTISEKKREILYDEIVKKAIDFNVSVITHDEIDKINILQATKKGMLTAVEGLLCSLSHKDWRQNRTIVLVDAVELSFKNFDTFKKGTVDLGLHTQAIVKGDAQSYNIAAASIIAKVTRDRIMQEYDLKYPQYGFKQNKGYGTKRHIAALKEYGMCEIHRKTFCRRFND